MQDDPRINPFNSRERVISTGASVLVAVVVMALTRSLIWGLVTFLVFGIFANAFLLWRRDRRKRK